MDRNSFQSILEQTTRLRLPPLLRAASIIHFCALLTNIRDLCKFLICGGVQSTSGSCSMRCGMLGSGGFFSENNVKEIYSYSSCSLSELEIQNINVAQEANKIIDSVLGNNVGKLPLCIFDFVFFLMSFERAYNLWNSSLFSNIK